MKKTLLTAGLLAAFQLGFAQFPTVPGTTDIYYNQGKVGIGNNAPSALFDVSMNQNLLYDYVSGIRLTYPMGLLGEPSPVIHTSLFEITRNTTNGPENKFLVNRFGNVGIGVQYSDPLLTDERVVITDNDYGKIDLHVKGFSLIDGFNGSLLLGGTTGAKYGEWGIEYNMNAHGLNFWKPGGSNNFGNYFMFISDAGNVSIGTEDSKGYKLAVKGNMIAEKVVVKLYSNWPDFVFSKSHKLMSLPELERYIAQNSHLPDVPSAEEVKEKGIDLGTMDATLLQKIEELTLYVIELKKEIDALKKEGGR